MFYTVCEVQGCSWLENKFFMQLFIFYTYYSILFMYTFLLCLCILHWLKCLTVRLTSSLPKPSQALCVCPHTVKCMGSKLHSMGCCVSMVGGVM